MRRGLLVVLMLFWQGFFGTSVADTLSYPVNESEYIDNYYNGRVFFAGEDHLGEDINLVEGTPIRAIGNGTIVVYRASDGYGELVAVIEHDLGTEYAFINAYGKVVKTRVILSISGHIRDKRNRTDTTVLSWKVGDTVSRGDVIGYVNNSSHPDLQANDPNGDGLEHLHEGIRLSDQATAQALDPKAWFRGYEKETDQGKYFSSAGTYRCPVIRPDTWAAWSNQPYAPPFTSDGKLFFTPWCLDSSSGYVEIFVSGSSTVWIHHSIYTKNQVTGTQTSHTALCSEEKSGDWCPGVAMVFTQSISVDTSVPEKPTLILAYVCRWSGTAWACSYVQQAATRTARQ